MADGDPASAPEMKWPPPHLGKDTVKVPGVLVISVMCTPCLVWYGLWQSIYSTAEYTVTLHSK